MRLKKLIKSLNLFEGKLEVRPNYPKINDDDFDMLINLDPTYNGGNELGKYSKWILNLYNKVVKDKLAYEKWVEQTKMGNNFPQPMRKSTDKQEDFKKIPSLLRQFTVLNNKLKTNIDKITSISELYKVVNDAKDKGLSDNSKVQKGIDLFKKSVEKGGEVVFKNGNWVILVPKTLKSSVVFGDDTNWCTTSPNGQLYNYYLKKYGGKYFINLNLQTGDLYQFHFESEQFMNSDDNDVNIKDIINDDSVIKFYLNYLYDNIKNDKKINATLLPIILKLDNNPPKQVQLAAVNQSGLLIKYIKNPSEQVQMEAVNQSGLSIKYIKNPSEKVQLAAVNQSGWSIQFIKNPSEQVQLMTVKRDGCSIQFIKNPSEQVQMEAVKQNGWSIEFIKNPSEQVQLEAVKEDGRYIHYIKNPSEQVQMEAVKQYGHYIQYIKNPSEQVQLMAVKQDDGYIRFIKNPSEKVKKYVRMKTHKSTNKSIDKEINEVLKLSGVNLTEGIVDVAKYYPKLDIETIKRLMNLDPTYNGGNELGKYGKWILNLYNKFVKDKLAYEKWEEQKKLGNNFPQPMRKSTDKQEDFEKIPNLLKQFNVLNNKLKTNIDDIKSISELYKVVNDAKTSGLSESPKVQKGIDLFKKSVQKGGEVVFKNSNWAILVPETLESSVVFGDDTNWCTTAPNGRMYYRYLEIYDGKYFINLNLQTGDLYQFHFESNQFKNSDDSDVEFKDTIKDESVKKFYLDYLYNNIKDDKTINTALLPIILKLDNNPPKQVKMMAVQQDGYNIKYIKNPSEQLKMEAVKQNGWSIKYIKNPSEEVQMEAVKQNGNAIQFIKNPTEEMKLEAVKENGFVIQFIKNPSEQVQIMAVKEYGSNITYIENPSEQVQMEAVKQNGKYIQYIKNPTEQVQIMAVKEADGYIQYIKNPTKQVQLMAVQQYSGNIIYIETPSEQVQMEVVKQNGRYIQYIKNPSEQLQLMAVKQNGKYIQYIKNPTKKVQLEAVKQDGQYIQYIKNPSEELQLMAVKEYGSNIIYIENPSEQVQIIAVQQNGKYIKYIKNPTEKVKKYAEKKKTVSECLKYM